MRASPKYLLLALTLALGIPKSCGQVQIQFDYSYDTLDFFGMSDRRSALDAAALAFTSRIHDTWAAINPPGNGDGWSLSFLRPDTGDNITLTNIILPMNSVTIYVGGMPMGGAGSSYAGYADFLYHYSTDGHNAPWASMWQNRTSPSNFDAVGGSIAFDNELNFHFDPSTPPSSSFNGTDFYTTAVHEIAHLLGFANVPAFNSHVLYLNGVPYWTGAKATSLYGGNVKLRIDGDGYHIDDSVFWQGNPVCMSYEWHTQSGDLLTRKNFTELDYAMLDDMGYGTVPEPYQWSLITALLLAGVSLQRRAARRR